MSSIEFDDLEEKESIRSYSDILKEKQNVEFETATSIEQAKVEKNVLELYRIQREPILNKYRHIHFLKNSLSHLSKDYECLDSSRPWLCYWILHSLHILGATLDDEDYAKVVIFLAKCQDPEGGFGGGPGQYPHLASTYAAVNALCIIGTKEAYSVINRHGLRKFLKILRNSDGSFCMHVDGEIDIRGVYCALVVAKLTNIYTPDIFKDTEKWIGKCQTWEGGFSGCPGLEAHGGYAYCGLASLILLGKTDAFNLSSFMRWIVNRQMRLEGGFQGRTNKLVDGCYSFWQGGAFPLINTLLAKEKNIILDHWLFDQAALQEYLLLCCQHPYGGLRDKPEKDRDKYHTCYGLSGLSVAQNSPERVIIGSHQINAVKMIHPVYNLVYSTAIDSVKYFASLSIPEC
ncbi:protein farnesyltransferase subunit beta isoform X3 [Nasonia vitripennis]|nr:protein farnesyltransferase subunit beta isoform X3 [Nasonia vitripennis]XP_031787566.1 protein farnesyltransferase subunit beta isoform X3 [Nasonia vitripennis]XP_031787567.1 protein farnesyltransferase subunit beta isoform X3 [Nasonia vitripennis]XP_032456328.1 protein farnesyltransferase subunit beta isoform X3 [Nasonia vitripennis]